MINRIGLWATAAAAGVVAFSPAALAADMPVKAPTLSPVSTYGWTGFYAGGHIGASAAGTRVRSFGNDISDDNGDTADLFRSGLTGGAQVGFNLQFAPNFVAGVEADIAWLNSKRTICLVQYCGQGGGGDVIQITSDVSSVSTLRGRLGYAWDRYLLYVTGGGAWVRVRDRWTDLSLDPGDLREQRKTLSGWTIGGGIEAALWGNWTAKAEYLFVDVGTLSVADDDASMTFKHHVHLARLGLNYRFWQPANMGTTVAATTAPFSWTGFYVGLNAGVGVSGTTVTDLSPGSDRGFFDIYKAGVTGGAQAGYNWQAAPGWILGVEGDAGFLNNSRTFCQINNNCSSASAIIYSSKSDFVSTLRARAGWIAWQRALLYATGGAAWVHVEDSFLDTGTVIQQSKTLSGWTVGGGLEAAIGGHWTVKAEYLYIDVGSHSFATTSPAGYVYQYDHRYHVARFGLNYLFGGGPVVARY
jgi:outer membrane immunogenic protein